MAWWLVSALALAQDASGPPPSRVVEDAPREAILNGRPVGNGLGVALGYPTGLAYAWKPDGGRVAIQAGAGWSWPSSLRVHVDWIYTVYRFQDPAAPQVSFPFYVGVGGKVALGDKKAEGFMAGIRVPLGVAVEPAELPLDVFVELVPIVQVWPETTLRADVALGARVYFF